MAAPVPKHGAFVSQPLRIIQTDAYPHQTDLLVIRSLVVTPGVPSLVEKACPTGPSMRARAWHCAHGSPSGLRRD